MPEYRIITNGKAYKIQRTDPNGNWFDDFRLGEDMGRVFYVFTELDEAKLAIAALRNGLGNKHWRVVDEEKE